MYLDEIGDLRKDITFQLWFLEKLSLSEAKNKLKEIHFDRLVEFRDFFKDFMEKWDLKDFFKEYEKENGVFDI